MQSERHSDLCTQKSEICIQSVFGNRAATPLEHPAGTVSSTPSVVTRDAPECQRRRTSYSEGRNHSTVPVVKWAYATPRGLIRD